MDELNKNISEMFRDLSITVEKAKREIIKSIALMLLIETFVIIIAWIVISFLTFK